MSERKKFIERWSRRKQEAERETKQPAGKPEPLENSKEEQRGSSLSPAKSEEGKSAFDLESLPSLDSITATTDIRAFLAPGVPEGLKHAALQRVWRTDPAIRDFVELLENSWDFNDPNGIHGFGPLEVTEQMKAAVEAMFDREPLLPEPAADETKESKQPEPERPAELAQREDEDETVDQVFESGLEEPANVVDAALQKATTKDETKNENANDPNTQRAHGGALPR